TTTDPRSLWFPASQVSRVRLMNAKRILASSATELPRRDFLRGVAALPLAYAMRAALPARAQEGNKAAAGSAPALAGLIMRQKEPANLEFPFAALERFIVPNELFYVRNHFPVPKLDAKSWRL